MRVGKNVWNNSSEESKLMSMIDLICDTMLCYVTIIIEPHRAHGVNLVLCSASIYFLLFSTIGPWSVQKIIYCEYFIKYQL